MKYMLVIAYDGSKFYGFQRQKTMRSVQGYLEEILTKVLNEPIEIKGAGRTDAKVHAKYQVVHFVTTKPVNNLKAKLNSLLKDVRIKKVQKVNDDFHARHSVKNKTYLYKIDLSLKKDNNYYTLINNKLNITKMKKASKLFLGTHDYHNFVAGKRDNYITTISKINIYKINKTIYLKFKGTAFYRYMVRNLVGALIEVGKGKVDIEVIESMLKFSEKEKRLPTARPEGLYLINIEYI